MKYFDGTTSFIILFWLIVWFPPLWTMDMQFRLFARVLYFEKVVLVTQYTDARFTVCYVGSNDCIIVGVSVFYAFEVYDSHVLNGYVRYFRARLF